MMLLGFLLLLLVGSLPIVKADMPDTLDIGPLPASGAGGLFGGFHPRSEYELPAGVKRRTQAADAYYTRWLQCSTMAVWCTVEEVFCGCTYEPMGTWYRGQFAWNSGLNATVWPYCQPGLASFYAGCGGLAREAAACRIPPRLRQYNGDYKCVNHPAADGGGYAHEGVASMQAPLP